MPWFYSVEVRWLLFFPPVFKLNRPFNSALFNGLRKIENYYTYIVYIPFTREPMSCSNPTSPGRGPATHLRIYGQSGTSQHENWHICTAHPTSSLGPPLSCIYPGRKESGECSASSKASPATDCPAKSLTQWSCHHFLEVIQVLCHCPCLFGCTQTRVCPPPTKKKKETQT